MADVSQYENDQFLRLLTDALRAGPGSPQWHDAVSHLQGQRGAEAEEYRLLIQARENLENGREYRAIRPGPNFTRKVMQQIDEEASRVPSVRPINLLVILAALGIVAMLIALGFMLSRGGQVDSASDLERTYFSRTAVAGDFSGGVPAEWQSFGLTPVAGAEGLVGAVEAGAAGRRGGGIYLAGGMPAEHAFAIESKLKARPNPQVDLQIFLAEQKTFEGPTATSAREFVVDINGGQISVFKPDGKLAIRRDGSQAVEPLNADGGSATILVKVGRTHVVVQRDGRVIFAGEHGLSAGQARWPGVRFLTADNGKNAADAAVQSLRILKPN